MLIGVRSECSLLLPVLNFFYWKHILHVQNHLKAWLDGWFSRRFPAIEQRCRRPANPWRSTESQGSRGYVKMTSQLSWQRLNGLTQGETIASVADYRRFLQNIEQIAQNRPPPNALFHWSDKCWRQVAIALRRRQLPVSPSPTIAQFRREKSPV